MSARFEKTLCSQCGGEFGPGDQGFSNCESHASTPTPHAPSDAWTPAKTVRIKGRACRVYYSTVDGSVSFVMRSVDLRQANGTGSGWRRLPLKSAMAEEAIALASAQPSEIQS